MSSVDMHASSRSASLDSPRAPSVVPSAPSQLAPSEKTNAPVPVQVFEAHGSSVTCASFFPDENKLVSGSDDGTLRIWDRKRKTGGVEVLTGHTGPVCEVDVSPDGSMVVSGSHDTTVRIWNPESGNTMQVLRGHEGWVRSVEFSRDSRRVVSGSWDGTLRVWSVETGELKFEPIECTGAVWCVRYSPSGDRIASAANSIQIWSAETGIGILEIGNLNFITTSLAWDGSQVIGRDRGNVTVWNSHDGERLLTWKVHDATYIAIRLSLRVSPTQTHLVTGNETTLEVFDIPTGERVATLKHDRNVDGVAYSPSGCFIATGSDDNKVYLWQIKSPAPSFSSSFLDQPAIPAGLSRHGGGGVDRFWDSPSDVRIRPITQRDQQASPQPQGIFNKVKDTFTGLFARRPALAAQNVVLTSSELRPDHLTQLCVPQNPGRESIELVEVAAGKDRPYVAIIDPPKFNRVQKILYTIIHCRKPDEEEEEVAAAPDTTADSSQMPVGKTVIDTQPQRNEMVAGPSSAPSAVLKASKPSACVQSTPLRDPSSHRIIQIPYSVSPSSTAPVTSMPPSSQQMDFQSGNNCSLDSEEVALIKEYRRLKDTSKTFVVGVVAEPTSSNTPRPTPTQQPAVRRSVDTEEDVRLVGSFPCSV